MNKPPLNTWRRLPSGGLLFPAGRAGRRRVLRLDDAELLTKEQRQLDRLMREKP